MDIRPIDANALWKRCSDLYDRHDNIYCAYEEIDNAPTLSLNTLRDAIYQDAVTHGLWEESDRLAKEAAEDDDLPGEKSFVEKFFKWHEAAQLIFFEGDEMLSAVEEYNWDSATEELADVVIMAMSAAGYLGIDIDAAIRRKMEINKARPWKHGKE
jgi:NTP pyrophosphatase (non-canonical NTP hydrolase)